MKKKLEIETFLTPPKSIQGLDVKACNRLTSTAYFAIVSSLSDIIYFNKGVPYRGPQCRPSHIMPRGLSLWRSRFLLSGIKDCMLWSKSNPLIQSCDPIERRIGIIGSIQHGDIELLHHHALVQSCDPIAPISMDWPTITCWPFQLHFNGGSGRFNRTGYYAHNFWSKIIADWKKFCCASEFLI